MVADYVTVCCGFLEYTGLVADSASSHLVSSQDSVFDESRYTENPVPERSGSVSEELRGNLQQKPAELISSYLLEPHVLEPHLLEPHLLEPHLKEDVIRKLLESIKQPVDKKKESKGLVPRKKPRDLPPLDLGILVPGKQHGAKLSAESSVG